MQLRVLFHYKEIQDVVGKWTCIKFLGWVRREALAQFAMLLVKN